ncbi:MAG: SpoIIE family protein phosphatase [Mycobacterium leprae]
MARLWNPLFYAAILFGFLAGRALPGSQIAPVGIALFAAIRCGGMGRKGSLLVGLAVAYGSWTVRPNFSILWVGAALLAIHLLSTAFRWGAQNASPLGAALLASTAVAVPAIALLGTRTLVFVLFWCGLTGVLALVFSLGISGFMAGTVMRGGFGDSFVPGLVLVAAVFCGLAGLTLHSWVVWQDMATGLAVLLFAYIGGAPMGASSAAILGTGFLLTYISKEMPGGVNPEMQAMAYVMAGLLGGTFRDLGRLGVSLAFVLGLMTYFMANSASASSLMPMAVTAGASTLVFLLLPRRWLHAMPPVGLPLRVALPPRDEQPISEPETLADHVRGLSRVLREVSRAFQPAATLEGLRDQSVGPAFEHVTERVCQSCAMYRNCWEDDLQRTYQLFSDLWGEIECEGPLLTQPPPEELGRNCIYPSEISATLNYLHELHCSHNRWERRLVESRTVAAEYVKNAAHILEQFAEDVARGVVKEPAAPTVKVESGVARLPKRGGQTSGDSYMSLPLMGNRYLMALSDGMGAGSGAASESRQALQLLQELLNAGFATDLAVNTVNSVLLLRDQEESFATLDLCLVDMATGKAEFVKIGAAPTFIKRGPDITMVKQSSVPVGIINRVDFEPEFRSLVPGDTIVMITDGIWDVSMDDLDKERWLLNHLGRMVGTNPEEMAESILARAQELTSRARDDMSVLVARIDSANGRAESVPEVKRPPSEGWAPVRLAPRGDRKTPPSPRR